MSLPKPQRPRHQPRPDLRPSGQTQSPATRIHLRGSRPSLQALPGPNWNSPEGAPLRRTPSSAAQPSPRPPRQRLPGEALPAQWNWRERPTYTPGPSAPVREGALDYQRIPSLCAGQRQSARPPSTAASGLSGPISGYYWREDLH